jgi:hypothetical protein
MNLNLHEQSSGNIPWPSEPINLFGAMVWSATW